MTSRLTHGMSWHYMMRMKRYSIMQQIPYLDFIYVRRITPRQKNIWTIFQNTILWKVIIREDYSRSREKSKKHMKNMKILFFPALVHLILFFPQWRDWHCGKMISVMRDFCQGRYRQLHIHWKWENIMSIRQCLILYVQGKM